VRKRLIIIPLAVAAVAVALLAGVNLFAPQPVSDQPASVAVTWGLLAEVVYRLTGGELEVVQLLPAGFEIHDWEPTPEAIRAAQRSRLVLYTFEGFDDWAVEIAESAGVKAVKVGQNLPMLLERGEHGHDHGDGHDKEHQHEYDVHVWLSPVNMAKIVENVAAVLIQEFPQKGVEIMRNRDSYLAEIRTLDNELKLMLQPYRGRLFITQHDAFRYFAEHYGLRVLPVLGAEEEEPSAAQLAEVVVVIGKEGVKVVYAEDGFTHPVLNTLARDTGVKIEMLYTLESLTLDDVMRGEGYVNVMRRNGEALVKGFG